MNTRRIQVYLPLVPAYIAGFLRTRRHLRRGCSSHDALNRLLAGPKLLMLLQMAVLTIVDRSKEYLVLDDVLLKKTGKGVCWLFSPTLGKKIRALNLAVLGWTDRTPYIPRTSRLYKPPEWQVNEVPGTGDAL